MAAPMTPSSRPAISSTRVSSLFQSKSPALSRGVASGFCWPNALLASVITMAKAASFVCTRITRFSLMFDHFRNGRLGEARECGDRGVCCRVNQPQQTDIHAKIFAVYLDRPHFQMFPPAAFDL